MSVDEMVNEVSAAFQQANTIDQWLSVVRRHLEELQASASSWKEDAKRYASNAKYWRTRFEQVNGAAEASAREASKKAVEALGDPEDLRKKLD